MWVLTVLTWGANDIYCGLVLSLSDVMTSFHCHVSLVREQPAYLLYALMALPLIPPGCNDSIPALVALPRLVCSLDSSGLPESQLSGKSGRPRLIGQSPLIGPESHLRCPPLWCTSYATSAPDITASVYAHTQNTSMASLERSHLPVEGRLLACDSSQLSF